MVTSVLDLIEQALPPHVFEERRAQLFALMQERSYRWRKEPFKLKAGGMSHVYFDVRQTSLTGEGAHLIAMLFLHIIHRSGLRPSAIGGLTLGADPLVASTIAWAHTHMNQYLTTGFLVRAEAKGHGAQDLIVGAKHLPGDSLTAICDDVITSGGSMIDAGKAAKARGFRVGLCLAVVDREENEGRQKIEIEFGVPVVSIFTRAEFETGTLVVPHQSAT